MGLSYYEGTGGEVRMKIKNINKLKSGDPVWWDSVGFDDYESQYVEFQSIDSYNPRLCCYVRANGINCLKVHFRDIRKHKPND